MELRITVPIITDDPANATDYDALSEFPRRVAVEGRAYVNLEWACCVSSIGPVCQHKAVPA